MKSVKKERAIKLFRKELGKIPNDKGKGEIEAEIELMEKYEHVYNINPNREHGITSEKLNATNLVLLDTIAEKITGKKGANFGKDVAKVGCPDLLAVNNPKDFVFVEVKSGKDNKLESQKNWKQEFENFDVEEWRY